jgi:hypothetical protein
VVAADQMMQADGMGSRRRPREVIIMSTIVCTTFGSVVNVICAHSSAIWRVGG